MTDKEIVKVLKYCTKNTTPFSCDHCKLGKEDNSLCGCTDKLLKLALDLINSQQGKIDYQKAEINLLKDEKAEMSVEIISQQAEIERLNEEIKKEQLYNLRMTAHSVKSEAIKEFAEKFENKINEIDFPKYAVVEKMLVICKKIMNDTVKEMVGEQK